MTATAQPLPAAVRALLDPTLHGCDPASVALRETHASWVVLAGERAYKVKKPIRFAFLDQSTLARRRAACEAELALNRALAPDVYLGVCSLAPTGDGERLGLGPAAQPAAVEYAIEMRRFDESATLAGLIDGGRLEEHHVRAVAERLAAFHRAAPVAADLPATPADAAVAALRLLDGNAEELIEALGDERSGVRGRGMVVAQWRCASAWASAHAATLAARAVDGHVRELHGDLRAEHVLPGPPVRIVDRLEFNRDWRQIDVADELAFLAMDLTALGRPDAARALLDAYRGAGGDLGAPGLVAFHAIHKAHVRAKVALLRAAQSRPPEAVAARALAEALLAVAERFAWRLRLPQVLVVCGPSASGKSCLASELARRSGRPVLSADVVRKQLAGIPATSRADDAAYTPEMNRRTHRALARAATAASEGAIVDATFRNRVDRAAFAEALGGDTGTVVHIELTAPAAVVRERAQRRLADPGRISDATPARALSQLAEFEPLAEVTPERHHLLRSDRPPAQIADALAAALDGAAT
ncbi:AAA family ATPase [Conexibacter sp. CPCC 206217]|uniref:bifunctional aminoglycoside phosphotransferase/ATP-binding protein n=1 Tax=Conexibacter sp. CPCC 206217 TaxID=3064574 RepID=UPI0027259221|nr:AAA family ATPase [Conexibacter sp. CPCC 206217]MDO8212553.1 AAA family ATPase [Conexibacter sp. CPCC 206217]